jgi:uncharacterized protein
MTIKGCFNVQADLIVSRLLFNVHVLIANSAKMAFHFGDRAVDDKIKTQLEAAAFRRLLHHFQTHTEVQNIDLMLLADFCRNCLAKWYVEAAQSQGLELTYDQARELIYGMPYKDWQAKFQQEATPEQLAAFDKKMKSKS